MEIFALPNINLFGSPLSNKAIPITTFHAPNIFSIIRNRLQRVLTPRVASQGVKVKVRLEARDADGKLTGSYENENDIGVKALAQLIQQNLLAGVAGGATNILDTGNVSRSIAANSAATVPRIVAGIGTTAAAFADKSLQTATAGSSGNIAATIAAISTNTFTVTGTITNTSGATIAYSEVGIDVTVATFVFLLCHDVFTALNVSNNGTLAVTYTFTFT